MHGSKIKRFQIILFLGLVALSSIHSQFSVAAFYELGLGSKARVIPHANAQVSLICLSNERPPFAPCLHH